MMMVLTKSMRKRVEEEVLWEDTQVGRARGQEGTKLLKMDVEETTHNDEQEKLEAPFENIEFSIIPKFNYWNELSLWQNKSFHRDQFGILLKRKKIQYHEIVLSNPCIWEAEILHLHKWINELLQSQEKDASKDRQNDHLSKMNLVNEGDYQPKIQ